MKDPDRRCDLCRNFRVDDAGGVACELNRLTTTASGGYLRLGRDWYQHRAVNVHAVCPAFQSTAILFAGFDETAQREPNTRPHTSPTDETTTCPDCGDAMPRWTANDTARLCCDKCRAARGGKARAEKMTMIVRCPWCGRPMRKWDTNNHQRTRCDKCKAMGAGRYE